MAELTAERARKCFTYNPLTGALVSRRGKQIGYLASGNYLRVSVDGANYAAHRVVWLLLNGTWPDGYIDHINGVRTDNRIANLRDVSRTENNQNQRRAHSHNKSSGLLGASWHKRDKQWAAHISVNNKQKHLGNFATAEEAHAAYLIAKRLLHPGCTI